MLIVLGRSGAAMAQDDCATEAVEVECNLRSWASAPTDTAGKVDYRITYVYPGGDSSTEERRQRIHVRVPATLTHSVEAFLTTFPYQTCDAQQAVGECSPAVSSIRVRVPPALAEHVIDETKD